MYQDSSEIKVAIYGLDTWGLVVVVVVVVVGGPFSSPSRSFCLYCLPSFMPLEYSFLEI